MPIGPGSVLVTASLNFLDDGGSKQESLSFVATEPIPAGTVLRLWDVDLSPAYVDYTVGVNGLNAGDRVTFHEASDAFSTSHDPSAASHDAGTFGTIVGSSFSIGSSSTFAITTEIGGVQELIAAINSGSSWETDINSLLGAGVSRAALDAYTGSPSPVIGPVGAAGGSFYIMFGGTNISGYHDSSNWVGTQGPMAHDNPNIDGVTYETQDANIDVTCFAAGTLIATAVGEAPVETLTIGDVVRTADGRDVPVKWIGRQTVVKAFAKERARLVRIAAGTLGNHSDLYVTGDHGMIVDGMVINAAALVNGTTISMVPLAETEERFTVYHVETDAHDVILANGAASESYLDVPGRKAFDNYAEYLTLYGAEEPMRENPMPRVASARLLPEALRARLAG